MAGIRVGFAGLTHLGICSAVAAAQKGFLCICFDPDAIVVSELRAGRLSIHEPGIRELSALVSERLIFTSDVRDLNVVDLCFVAADVPTDSNGKSDLTPIRSLIDTVEVALGADAAMIVLSQVPPGFSRSLSRSPARRFYQVETLVFGQAVERALKPERIIVGCAAPADPLPVPYRKFLEAFDCPVLPMRYESAELAKIAINMFLVSSVTTTNTIAELCENIGADWQEVAPALRLDRRIGPHAYLSAGLGIGGGNLERDLVAFSEIATSVGTDTEVVTAWRNNSLRRRQWALQVLVRRIPPGLSSPTVAVLGLAYKQDTASIRNSSGVDLIHDMPGNWLVRAFDPVVKSDVTWRIGGLVQANDEYDACLGADALAIMTPWPQFRSIGAVALAQRMRGNVVIDPFGVLNVLACRKAGLSHFQLGRG